jgi:hypothetical protein
MATNKRRRETTKRGQKARWGLLEALERERKARLEPDPAAGGGASFSYPSDKHPSVPQRED